MRFVRNCTPALALSLSPRSLNFTFSSKSPNVALVQRNSLRGTTVSSDPPTMHPSSIFQVFSVSPSHPANVFPSKSDLGSARVEATNHSETITARVRRSMGEPPRKSGIVGQQRRYPLAGTKSRLRLLRLQQLRLGRVPVLLWAGRLPDPQPLERDELAGHRQPEVRLREVDPGVRTEHGVLPVQRRQDVRPPQLDHERVPLARLDCNRGGVELHRLLGILVVRVLLNGQP